MKREIGRFIDAGYPLIFLRSHEEMRARQAVMSLAKREDLAFYSWTLTDGIQSITDGTRANDTEHPVKALKHILSISTREEPKSAIWLLHDFRVFLDKDPMICRLVRDLVPALKAIPSSIVFLGPQLPIPPELSRDVATVEVPFPDEAELIRLLKRVAYESDLDSLTKQGGEDAIAAVARAAKGLTSDEAESVFALATLDECLTSKGVWTLKAQAITDEALTFIDKGTRLEEIGGLANLKAWLTERADTFTPEARAYGLPSPKGVLIVGPPGTGKSLTSKAASAVLDCPTLRLNIGACMHSLVGESEEALRKVIGRAESIAPCVLWIDEIDKAFAGMGERGGDGGLFKRMMGELITWLQEHTAPVFVIATANDITVLPSALTRKGRLDERFYVDLPDPIERAEIFAIHVGKRPSCSVTADECAELAEVSEGFVGAEIEQCIIDSMFAAYHDGGRPTTAKDIRVAISRTVPSSRTYARELNALREWSENGIRPAGRDKAPATSPAASEGRRNVRSRKKA